MFNNIMELIELIESGKSNEEIINERLQYLNSEEYRAQRKPTQIFVGNESKAIMFHDGFIPKDMPIGLGNGESCNCYVIDDINVVYNSIIDSLRNNRGGFKNFIKEHGGISQDYICYFIKSYFTNPEFLKSERDKDAWKLVQAMYKNYYIGRAVKMQGEESGLSESEIKDILSDKSKIEEFLTAEMMEKANKSARNDARNKIGIYISDWITAKKVKAFDGDFLNFMELIAYRWNSDERKQVFDEIKKQRFESKRK